MVTPAMRCMACGAELMEGARFCAMCGQTIDRPSPMAWPEPGAAEGHALGHEGAGAMASFVGNGQDNLRLVNAGFAGTDTNDRRDTKGEGEGEEHDRIPPSSSVAPTMLLRKDEFEREAGESVTGPFDNLDAVPASLAAPTVRLTAPPDAGTGPEAPSSPASSFAERRWWQGTAGESAPETGADAPVPFPWSGSTDAPAARQDPAPWGSGLSQWRLDDPAGERERLAGIAAPVRDPFGEPAARDAFGEPFAPTPFAPRGPAGLREIEIPDDLPPLAAVSDAGSQHTIPEVPPLVAGPSPMLAPPPLKTKGELGSVGERAGPPVKLLAIGGGVLALVLAAGAAGYYFLFREGDASPSAVQQVTVTATPPAATPPPGSATVQPATTAAAGATGTAAVGRTPTATAAASPTPRTEGNLQIIDERWTGRVIEAGGLNIRRVPRLDPGTVVGSVAQGQRLNVEGRVLNGQEAEPGKGTVWLIIGPNQYIYFGSGYIERIP